MGKSDLSVAFERLLRRHSSAVHLVLLIPFYALCVVCIGVSLAPAIGLFRGVDAATSHWGGAQRWIALGLAIASGYMVYGLVLLFVVPLVNFLLRTNLGARSGTYYSLGSVRWWVHNGLTYVVRFTFLECITPTPLNLLFFRMMGMKIGRHVQINSSRISDPSLITLGDRVTIGGSATIVAHYGMGGFLVLSPVTIGAGATVGLCATIMGGVEIGERARILPNSAVLPRTKVPAGEIWGGVPARRIEARRAGAAPASAVGFGSA